MCGPSVLAVPGARANHGVRHGQTWRRDADVAIWRGSSRFKEEVETPAGCSTWRMHLHFLNCRMFDLFDVSKTWSDA